MKKKIAIITGVTGQDGSYLAELLLAKNYIVHGLKRRTSIINTSRVDHLYESQQKLKNKSFFLHYADLTDVSSIVHIIKSVKPDEIYNLAAQSHVQASFENPEYTCNVNGLGTLRILEAIRILNKKIKFYQASSSEMFGKIQDRMQDENTKFYPLSPYATSKLFGYWITKNYRESYGIYACNGILFNHESPRRGETFVTRKITIGLTKICKGHSNILELGNLDSLRDWGHTKDYVEMQWRMLQQKKPKDYVIATGKQMSVRKFIEMVGFKLGFEIKWKHKGIKEIGYINKIKKNYGYDIKKNQIIIKVNKKYFRPNEVNNLLGNSKLARQELGWKAKINIKELIAEMVEHDLQTYS
jgi:GDPmannose 4,6-dehydratase